MKPRTRWCLTACSVVTVVLVIVLVVVLKPWAKSEPKFQPRDGVLQIRYRRAVVSANGVECATVGRKILEKGGTAVDAAIATLFCDGIACAQCMGLGGGFMAAVYDASTQQIRVLNARERAPAAAYSDMFANASSIVGGLAVAVPGELRGYGVLHREYGRLKWKELVQPTIALCRNGHRVGKYMAKFLKRYSKEIHAEPSLRELYVNPKTGEVWNEDDLIKDPLFAQTLDRIAEEGPETIHNGSMTSALVRDIEKFGGIITEDDLKNYRVEWLDPIAVPLSGKHTLYSVPLPGSGSMLAFILHMVNGWIGTGTDVEAYSNLYWHRTVETFKYAYAKRTGLGDIAHTDLHYDIQELERNLSSVAWATSFRELVNDSRTYNDWKHYGTFFESADDHGTAHVIVAAPDGSIVSLTSTINYIWGSQRRSRTLGFILNNEMADFSIPKRSSIHGLPPSPANLIEPGLQPLSSMVPSIVINKEGKVDMVVGAAGSVKITTQVALTVMQTLFEGDEIGEVFNRPRIHHQLFPMEVQHEVNFNAKVLAFLRARGHVTTQLDSSATCAAVGGALRDSDGYWVTAKDPRKNGSIDGL